MLLRKEQMKKLMVSVIILMSAGLVSASDDANNTVLSFKESSLEIGPEIFYHKYTESGMKETGMFYGINVRAYERKWVNRPPEEMDKAVKGMFGGELEFAYGQVDYDGHLLDEDNTPYTVDGIDNFLIDGRYLIGCDVTPENILQTLYSGIGYRFLQDDSSFDPAGYLRRSNYFYIPLGLKVEQGGKNGWSLGGSVEVDFLVYGQQYNEIDNYRIRNHQEAGAGFRAAVDIVKTGAKSNFKIQPFIRYWNIAESEDKHGYYEPENKTVQTGLQLVWSF
jgi:hypothetical protein